MNRSGRVAAAMAVALLDAGGATIATRPPPPPEIGTGAALAVRPAAEPAPSAVEPSPQPTRRPKATPSIDPSRARPATIPEQPRVARPTSLAIPGLDLRLAIRPGGLDQAGAMELPGTVREVSWYRFGPAPSERGATVIAGHVDTREEGVGPLASLGTLAAGDRIVVETGKGATTYAVDTVRQIDKSLLDLEALFSRAGARRLHLITCSGEYDAAQGGYQANLVVIARALSS